MEEKKQQRILIIDDDKFLLDMYIIKFKEHEFHVDAALGSMNAIAKLKEQDPYDIILLDLVMPTMDGFELLTEMKRKNLHKDAKIIILSNLGQPADIKRGEQLGADGYIVKANATPSEVVAKVRSVLAPH